MADTLPALVPRVATTASRVLPGAGALSRVRLMVVAALLPVLPVVLCTGVAAAALVAA